MYHSLKSKTVSGMIWNAVDKFAVQGIQFVLGIILARLLLPTDYGIIGMLTIFIAISQVFIDGGFSKALIQKSDRSEIDFSTVFYFNLGISIVFYTILFFLAPIIANFYELPTLISVLRVLSIVIIINSFVVVQTAKFTIDLNFKTMAIINLVSVFISGIIAVALAYKGYGVWSLVSQTIIRSLVISLVYWIISKWRPSIEFSTYSFKNLFSFGSKLLGAGIISTLFQNIYSILIGKIYSAKDLGYYSRGLQFAELSSGSITSIIQNVSFPLLASLQNDRNQLLNVYAKMMQLTIFFVFPIMTLLALLSEPIVRYLLTDKWLPAVPLLQWLCFARLFTPISALNMNILNAIGRSDLFLKLDILKIPLMLIALIVSIPFGVKGIVIGIFIVSFICFFINAYYPGKYFNYGAFNQIKANWKTMISVLLMSISVFIFMKFNLTDVLKIVLGGLIGVVIYYFSAIILKNNGVKEINVRIYSSFLKIWK